MIFDDGGIGLNTETLVEAKDAVVFFGGSDTENPVILRSSTNTLNDVLRGVSIDLVGTSEKPVELSINQDVDSMVSTIQSFVDRYNQVVDRIKDYTSFDPETFDRGTLFADSTVDTITNRLFRAVTGTIASGSGRFTRLFSIGITTGSGGKLTFDESKFREALEDDPQAVEDLFSTDTTGFGDAFAEVLDDLTGDSEGLLDRKDDMLQDQEELLKNRIEAMQELLDRKRASYERQFSSLESNLAALQNQQTSLSFLQQIVSGFTQ